MNRIITITGFLKPAEIGGVSAPVVGIDSGPAALVAPIKEGAGLYNNLLNFMSLALNHPDLLLGPNHPNIEAEISVQVGTDREPSRPVLPAIPGPADTNQVFLVNEIYDNKPDSKREEEFWAIASLRQKKGLLRAILDVQEIGDDPETILRSWVAAKMSTKKDQ